VLTAEGWAFLRTRSAGQRFVAFATTAPEGSRDASFLMIDLHSHILPALDDGADTLETSIEMARMAVEDGVTRMACTPHIIQGRYPNSTKTVLPAMKALQGHLDERGIPLTLVQGADVHVIYDLPLRLRRGEIPTLNGSRYFLLEPPHQVFAPFLEEFARRLLQAGYIPIITHPERLGWIRRRYDVVRRLHQLGCPLQLTAGSLLGHFGQEAEEFTVRIIEDGMGSIFASDAHGVRVRTPRLSTAMRLVAERWGAEMAENMFERRPAIILADGNLPSVAPRRSRRSSQAGWHQDIYATLNVFFRAGH
jgi:protein-tyrosine phosphatase